MWVNRGSVARNSVGDPEVDDLGGAFSGDHDVGGLDVPVHDTGGVSRVQPPAHIRDPPQCVLDGHAPASSEDLLQCAPVDERHDEVRAFAVRPVVVHGDDVGAVEGRGDPGLAPEPGERLVAVRVVVSRREEDLDRHLAVQRLVMGSPDLAHAAGAEEFDQFVSVVESSSAHGSGFHRIEEGAEGAEGRGEDRAGMVAFSQDALVDTATLCTSELVTNACVYAKGGDGSALWLSVEPARVRVIVYDGDESPPVIREVTPQGWEQGGRGLHLVDALTDGRWGTVPSHPEGKAVWFDLSMPR